MKPQRVGILGAGQMGVGIAQTAAQAGWAVVLADQNLALAEKGKAKLSDLLKRLVEKGKIGVDDATRTLDAIQRALVQSREALAESAERKEIQHRVDSLTSREREVLMLVVTGMLNKQIAAELGAAEKTIKVHRGRMMKKMQANSVAELVRMAEKVGVRAL